jgi:UDP-N-acetylmuramoylalanine--D-glutamate ligase
MKSVRDLIKNGGRFTVVGLGASGMSAARLLHSKGAAVTVTDARPAGELDRDFRTWLAQEKIDLESGGHSAEFVLRSDCVVVSPGVPLEIDALSAARSAQIPIIGEMGLAAAYVDRPMVAVTGTNGKSTTVRLLGDIFLQAGRNVFVGGNIGTPLADYVLQGEKADLLVLEVSSFQLDTIEFFQPQVAVLLNISPDHLDRYVDYQSYCASKLRIFRDQSGGQAAVINYEDPRLRQSFGGNEGRMFVFSLTPHCLPGAWFDRETVVLRRSSKLKQTEIYPLPKALRIGPNPANAMAAVIAARLMDCPVAAIQEALAQFSSLAHRMTEVAEKNGVLFIDDSKATNIGALQAALESMRRPVVLIAGGRDKRGDYRLLNQVVKEKVKAMVLIGEAREAMKQAFAGLTRIEKAEDMDRAVQKAYMLAEAGDAVLLSPACASFDMFTSYSHRGVVFHQAVKDLLAQREDRVING